MGLLAQLPLPQVILGPKVGQVDNRSRRLLFGGIAQTIVEDGGVGCAVANITEGQAKGVLYVEGSGRFHLLGHLLDQGQREGRYSLLIQNTLYQPHGLTAHRSRRHQQGQIDLVAVQLGGNLRRNLCQQPFGAWDKPHKRKMPRRR